MSTTPNPEQPKKPELPKGLNESNFMEVEANFQSLLQSVEGSSTFGKYQIDTMRRTFYVAWGISAQMTETMLKIKPPAEYKKWRNKTVADISTYLQSPEPSTPPKN